MSTNVDALIATLAEAIANRVLARLTAAQDNKPITPSRGKPDFISEAELARRSAISARTLQGWRAKGRGPRWVRLGRRVLYPMHEAELFLHNGASPKAARDTVLTTPRR
jgi:hypothetical protein